MQILTSKSCAAVLVALAITLSARAHAQCEPLGDTGPLEIPRLERFINDCKIDSVDSLIPLLPRSLVSNFVLMHESRALFADSVDPLNPRVILFSRDAKLILAFTGSPEKAGFNVLEAISFDERVARFTIHAADLSRPQKIFGQNPGACMGCHGNDPRPIWDTHPIWPGAYMSVSKSFQTFLARAKMAEVYRHLPLRSGQRFQNAEFTRKLSHLNSMRLARKISESDGFKSNPGETTALLLGCTHAANETSVLNEVKRVAHSHFAKRLNRPGIGVPPSEILPDNARIRILAEYLGLSLRGWTTTLENNSFLFSNGQYPMTQLVVSRLAERARLPFGEASRIPTRTFGALLPFSSVSMPEKLRPACAALGY
jgi:hypothetical protein